MAIEVEIVLIILSFVISTNSQNAVAQASDMAINYVGEVVTVNAEVIRKVLDNVAQRARSEFLFHFTLFNSTNS